MDYSPSVATNKHGKDNLITFFQFRFFEMPATTQADKQGKSLETIENILAFNNKFVCFVCE